MTPSLDGALEASVIGSFTNLGFRLRSQSWSNELPALDGETALVTGGSSGIGLAAARRMKELGARVIIVGRSQEKLDSALASLDTILGGDATAIRADLSTIAGVRSLAQRVLDEEPRLNVVVNGASVLPSDHELTDDGIELAVATNLVGPFLLTNLLIPLLIASVPAPGYGTTAYRESPDFRKIGESTASEGAGASCSSVPISRRTSHHLAELPSNAGGSGPIMSMSMLSTSAAASAARRCSTVRTWVSSDPSTVSHSTPVTCSTRPGISG